MGDALFSGQPVLEAGYVLAERYEVISLLGEGGMGAVYKAKDLSLDRVIALKTIRREYSGNRSILERFKQELILSTQVTHKNVVRIYDLGEAEAHHFVFRYGRHAADVMPYVVRDPEARRKVVEGEPDMRGEFDYQREHEMVVMPADCLLRRTRLGLFHPELLEQPAGRSSTT